MSTNEHANWCSYERGDGHCDCEPKVIKTKLWTVKGGTTRAIYALTNDKMRMVAVCESGAIGTWINSFQTEQNMRAVEGEPLIVNHFKEI